MADSQIQIQEIFYSIQGESVYSGLPCVFVRTHGCNLNCLYCDTITVKNPSVLNLNQILSTINQYSHINVVQVTGGEPLIHDEIYELFSLLKENHFTILLETNGAIEVNKVPDYVCKIIDVKTPGSGHQDSFLIKNLDFINPDKDNLKFVLSDLSDYKWMKNFLAKYGLYGSHVLVSTVFSALKPLEIVEKILEDGLNVRFQLQIHKYIGIQ